MPSPTTVQYESSDRPPGLLEFSSGREEVENRESSELYFRQWHTLRDLLNASLIYEIPVGSRQPSILVNVRVSFHGLALGAFGIASFRKFRGNSVCRAFIKGKSKSYGLGSSEIAEGPPADTWTVPSWKSEWMATLESNIIDDLGREIRAAQKLLTLEDNWDGEGSPGYSKATLDRATEFLRRHIRWVWERYDVWLKVPRISPGPNGSIDLHWETTNYELLVNIPTDALAPATFYGDDYGKISIKGSFDPSFFNFGLVTWLLRL